jgi:predicted nucleic acid-binding protein
VKQVFLDTSGLIAVVNADDHWHAKAQSVWAALTASSVSYVTTSLVLIELADGLSRIQYRPLALQIIDALHASLRVTIVQSDIALEARGWQLFRDRNDKAWGMTDCVSMTLMGDLEIEDTFTADHHFQQAGFSILLK